MKFGSATLIEVKSAVRSSHFMLFSWTTLVVSCLVGGNKTLEVVTTTIHGVWMGGNDVTLTTSKYGWDYPHDFVGLGLRNL